MYTDPISDMLTRIRNAIAVNKHEVCMPHSKFKQGVAELLQQNNFLDSVAVSGEGIEKKLESYPTLTMYLTFNPDEATLAELGTFTRKLFGLALLLEIRVDQSLIAGAALSWKAKAVLLKHRATPSA